MLHASALVPMPMKKYGVLRKGFKKKEAKKEESLNVRDDSSPRELLNLRELVPFINLGGWNDRPGR